MIAVLATSIPLLALFLPVAPLPPAVWQVVVADLVVWIAAFRVQRPRFEAYQAQLALRSARLAALEGRKFDGEPEPGKTPYEARAARALARRHVWTSV